MLATELNKLYTRDLDRLMIELESYADEESLWIKVDGINNSAGNLFMHLCGNLQHFIGAILAKTGYERQRDFEFNGKLSLAQITAEIVQTKQVLIDYFSNSEDADFQEEYPLQPFGYAMSVAYFMMHLHSHLSYHMGQINYHRRILSKSSI